MRKGIYTLHLIYSTLLGSFCVPGSLFCLLLFPSTNWCDLLELLIESAVCVNKFAIPSAAYVGNYHDQVAWWQQALCELGCWFLWSSFVLMTQSLFFGITGVWSIFFSRDKSGSDAEISMWPCSTTWFFCQCHKAALCFSSLSWNVYDLNMKAQFPVLPLKKKSQLILLINHF